MRALLRVLLTLVLVGFVAFLFLGYWAGSSWSGKGQRAEPTGTSGTIDTQRARQKGAELGEKAAVAVSEVKETVSEAAVTAKIKAKMALDDGVKARGIDVTTNGSAVTLTGKVHSNAERDRAVALARDTEGVTLVVDRLQVVR